MAQQSETLTGNADLRLPEFDTPPAEPHQLLRAWLDSAIRYEVREPYAMVLSTADREGKPSSRVLLMKELDDRGLLFTSFRGSRKGLELAASPWASATFYWRETLQQITVCGKAESLTDEESDALFAQRPVSAQATTAVSRQSRPLNDEAALRAEVQKLVDAGGPESRPPEWCGYRLVPYSVEFWYGSSDRLHRRLRYDRVPESSDTWSVGRLQP